MITRKPSRIVDSLVNSAHEDHFNMTKAIRDDAPITALDSVVKSINFEADGDGSYILRKPLIKKVNLNANQILLFNKEDVLTFDNGVVNISNSESILLKFYDNNLDLHEYRFKNGMSAPWLNIIKAYNTTEHTILNVVISHKEFLLSLENSINEANTDLVVHPLIRARYLPKASEENSEDEYAYLDEENEDYSEDDDSDEGSYSAPMRQLVVRRLVNTTSAYTGSSESSSAHVVEQYWNWMLVNGTWNPYDKSFAKEVSSLKRFVKIYKQDDEPNSYVFEIVHPEFNTITSNLDANNAETLDINLLLDNPYALRDLYDYGSLGCTKIVPYVCVEDDSDYTLPHFKAISMWELTEKGPYDNNTKGFQILVSSNPSIFNKKFLILKAFLTTAITNAKFYCCWEYSKDAGVSWSVCQEFLDKFQGKIEYKKVSDLTSEEFDKTAYDESLEKASSYLVDKALVLMDLTGNGYSFDDILNSRPDVLILENPNLNYKYRFSIYLDTEKDIPEPVDTTHTVTKTFFEATSGNLTDDGKITFRTSKNNSTNSPQIHNGKLTLYDANGEVIGNNTSNSPNRYGAGNSLTIVSNDENYKLKYVTITLAAKNLIEGTTNYSELGSSVGAIGGTYIPDAWKNLQSGKLNPYSLSSVTVETATVTTDDNDTPDDTSDDTTEQVTRVVYNAKNLWIKENQSKSWTVSNYISDQSVFSLVDLTRCLMNWDDGVHLNDVAGTTSASRCNLQIASISVTYIVKGTQLYTNTYLVSTTGTFSIPYSNVNELAADLTFEHDNVFSGDLYYNDNQAQLLIHKNNLIYSSGTNSSVIKFLNSISLPENVTRIVPWRGYLLVFTTKAIYLASYSSDIDGYNIKVLSNTVGVGKEDSGTIVPILNSVYFKSGIKIYKLVPNLYAASDDILNIHQVSLGIDNILEQIVNTYIETYNFGYSDSDHYMIFIPIKTLGITYCIIYDFTKKLWTLLEYPVFLNDIEKTSAIEAYVKDSTTLYYFMESMDSLISKGLEEYCTETGSKYSGFNLQMFINAIPYADYLSTSCKTLISTVVENVTGNNSHEKTFNNIMTPIKFEIDFGQKSSNYTLYKQFVETKLTLATLSIKDNFPITLDIYTDGVLNKLHWDTNTDGALWKQSLDDVGLLNTGFNIANADYNGIFRQLIVKYSGRGKSIRHVISGKSKALFKVYSMDVRARILPKKH